MSQEQQICPACGYRFAPEEAVPHPAGKGCPRCHAQILLDEVPAAEGSAPVLRSHLLSDGIIFDKYRIISFIGSGGMSEVYKAEHLLLKQIFALKVMKDLKSSDENGASKRFLREAKCFHQLIHPNIVRVFEIGCDRVSGMLYISMEYLAGGSLAETKDVKYTDGEILKVASDVARALEELEKHGMVHRDIKPSNIMRDSSGNCKLMDLGIAKNQWECCDAPTLTADHCMIGTPAYASPEQCRTPHNVDIRSDIYSLGVTLYQLASGVIPYAGETPLETILNVIHKEPLPLEKLPTELSQGCIALIRCMMEKSPEKRPADAAALKEMIRKAREGELVPRRRLIPPFTGIIAAAGSVLLLAAAGSAWLYFSGREDPPLVQEEVRSIAGSPLVLPEKRMESGKKSFSRKDFIISGEERTLEVRLEEYRRIIRFLNSPAAAELPFRGERLELFTKWEKNLENLMKRKLARQKRRIRAGVPPELKKDIEEYLKKQRPPFGRDTAGIKLVRRISEALQNRRLDPDSSFSDGRGVRRSLTGLVLSGTLPAAEGLLKKLIFYGADINAGHGPRVRCSSNMVIQRIRGRLTGIMSFNGADNVDLKDGRSMLLSVMDPEHTYLVCRPSGNYLDWPLADFLVESGARLDVENSQGRTPLHIAALHNRGELVKKILLAGGIDGDVRDQEGSTPYLLAVRNHASEAVRELTRFGFTSPVSEADRAQGALIYGIINNEPLQVEQALDAGASLEYLYANKLNALQNAVVFRRKDLVQFLLSRGASPESNAGMISLPSIAVCIVSPAIFQFLLEKSPLENMTVRRGDHQVWLPESVLAHFRKRPDLAAGYFDVMLKCRWDINREGPRGLNILERALLFRYISPQLIRLLLDRGADPEMLLQRKKVAMNRIAPELRRLITAAASKKK